MTDFNLYYIKNGDTIFVGNVIDSSFIYNVVSDTFALDMDIDSTNELQELYHEDNILVLTGAGPDSQVDLTPYMDVDSIYMEDYNLWYTKSGESGTPRFVGNVTDSSYIKQVVSDSSTVVENDYGTIITESPANTFGITVDSTKFATPYALTQINFIDSTNVLNSYGTTITESPANTFNIKVDSSLYATTYDMTLKENYITPGTTSQYWRGDKTWQTTPTGTVTGTGVNNKVAIWSSTTAQTYDNLLHWNPSAQVLGVGTASPSTGARVHIADGDLFIIGGSNRRFLMGSSVSTGFWGGMRWNTSNELQYIHSGYSEVTGVTLTTNSGYTGFRTAGTAPTTPVDIFSSNTSDNGTYQKWAYSASPTNYALTLKQTVTSGNVRFNFSQVNGGTTYNNVLVLDQGNVAIGHTDATEKLDVNGDIRGRAAYVDATNSPGTSGQVLSSTVTGTDWIDLPAGDITAVTVSAPITGGGTSGSVNIAVDTTDATSAALATQFDLLGKQATLVSGTNIKTVNSNSLVGSGDVSVGTVQSITVNAPLTTTQAPITTTATLGVDTTATTGSALATQFDISSKVSGSGTDNYIPRFNGTTAIENSNIYDDGTNIGIGTTSPTAKLSVAGALKVTGSTSGNTRIWGYDHTDGTMGIITIGSGLSLSGDALSATAAYAYWRLSANSGTAFAVTDNTLVNFNNSTGISWTRAASTGEMTATLADNSATNEIQSLSYNTGTRALGISSGSGVTLPLVTSSIPGLVSAYPNNTTSFLRGDGNWATPPTPAVTGSAPIVVTSGNISLNFGNGLALSGSQLQTTPVIMAFLNHSSGGYTTNFTAGETKKVDFTTALSNSSITTDVSTNDNITINSAGTYEINYNVCINAPTNFDEPTVSIYVNGSQQGTTVKSVWLTVAGQKQCISGTHVMALSSSNTVDMRVQHPQAQTGANIIAPQLKVQKLF
jgi:hypothetical protein